MVLRALAILLPWLALAPIANAAIVVALYAGAIVASCHGWGLALARRRDVAPLRAIQWGIATMIGLAGTAIAFGCFTAVAEVALLFGGVAIHSVVLGTRFAARAASPRDARYWLVPVVTLGALGAIAVLGAAGDFASRPFDDDGNVFGEIRRLADTGALGDPIGYPRAFQLGGHVALAALANVVGDPRAMRMFDALGMVLALAFTLSRIRPRDAHTALWATLVVIATSALALSVSEPSPMWLGVGLMLALFEPDVPAIPLGVVAGALIALRLAFAPLAIVGLVWGTRGSRRPLLAGIAAMLAVVAPYAIATARAALSVPASARAFVATPGGAGKLAIAAAIVLALLPLLVVALRELRGLAFASAAGLACIAAQLTGDHGGRFAWAIAIACVLALAIELARRPGILAPAAMLCSLVLCVLIHEGQEATGRASWYRRTSDLVDNIDYLAHSSLVLPADLDAILDPVPPTALVVLWLPEPERIDHARHRVIDLRTPRLAALRDGRAPRLEALATALGARYLLVAPDDAALQRQLLPRGPACAEPCTDGIALMLRQPIVARRDGLLLVDLAAR